jgi:hypothetical protein|tara:strand:+ start:295 stop:684 length:390 start_codon:yes stop_codon:yes gene_type:complete
MRYLVLILLLISCHPVSHIVVGNKREATSPTDVKVYLDYPESYEKIALVDAGSNFSFKDPVILFAWQSKMNKALERLKIEAASLGANGILIVNTDNKTYQSINSNENGVQTSTYEEKFIKAIAIHVPEI